MIFNALLIAVREIRRNLMRAFLTVLGVIIGVSSIITMVTLGQSATNAVRDQIANLGSNLLMIRPGASFGPRGPAIGASSFSELDVTLLGEQVPGIAAVAPVRTMVANTIHLQNARSTSVTGSTVDYFRINRWTIGDGRLFNEVEARSGAAVCVIGNTVRRELFGSADPIGARIRIGQSSCEVIGLLEAKGQAGLGDQDDTIIVPLTTLQRRLVGRTTTYDISQISISAAAGVDSARLSADITSFMRVRRNLQPNEENNFSILDTRQIAETLSSTTRLMTMLLTAVAGVSLIVGGIGIMNIMLVSVTERTREIGIRLSIGATAHEVLLQFLVEAITLSCVGGLIGVLIALGLCAGISQLIQIPFVFGTQINLLAFGFSAAVGVIFGFTPARRAARLDPIVALRHE